MNGRWIPGFREIRSLNSLATHKELASAVNRLLGDLLGNPLESRRVEVVACLKALIGNGCLLGRQLFGVNHHHWSILGLVLHQVRVHVQTIQFCCFPTHMLLGKEKRSVWLLKGPRDRRKSSVRRLREGQVGSQLIANLFSHFRLSCCI